MGRSSAHWDEYIKPIVEKYWKPLEMYGLRDAFVLKYDTSSQTKLALHHDASYVTGSVKLNDDYVGGELVFPRQDVSNINIPAGKLLFFRRSHAPARMCRPNKWHKVQSYNMV